MYRAFSYGAAVLPPPYLNSHWPMGDAQHSRAQHRLIGGGSDAPHTPGPPPFLMRSQANRLSLGWLGGSRPM